MSAGVLSAISLGLESTWGTPVVPDKSLAVRPGDGIQTDNDLQFVDEIKNQLVKHDEAFKGQVKHEGSYEFAFQPGYAGYLLLSHFGQVASVEKADSGVYDHTFTGVATKKSLTIEQAVGELVRRYAGAIVHSLTFSVAAGESLVCTAGIRAKSSASASAITPAYETLRRFHFADLSSLTVGGQALTPQNFELVSNNDHGFLHTLNGTHDAQYNYAKGWEVNGKFDLYLDSTAAAEYTDYINNTQQELEVVFTGDSIGASSNLGLTLTLPKIHYKAANNPITDDYNMVSVQFEAVRDQLEAVLTNEIASYA